MRQSLIDYFRRDRHANPCVLRLRVYSGMQFAHAICLLTHLDSTDAEVVRAG